MINESDKAHKANLSQMANKVDQKLSLHEKDMNQRFCTLQATIEAGKQSQDAQFKLLRDMLSQSVAASAPATRKAQKTTPGTSVHQSRQHSEDES